jgi:hypothetical protein
MLSKQALSQTFAFAHKVNFVGLMSKPAETDYANGTSSQAFENALGVIAVSILDTSPSAVLRTGICGQIFGSDSRLDIASRW